MTRLPVVGMAAMSMHLMVNGVYYSLTYPFRSEQHQEASLMTWLLKHFSGKDFFQFLTDKIVDLIYHPSWPITLLQLVQDLENPQADIQDISFKDFKTVTDFVFKFVLKDSSVPSSYCNRFVSEKTLNDLKEMMKPSGPPVHEKGLEAIIPSLKEFTLYGRVLDSFRKQCVHFVGDAKFWEVFVRESLNDWVELTESKDPALTRSEIVDLLLSYDVEKLRTTLGLVQKASDIKVKWDYL